MSRYVKGLFQLMSTFQKLYRLKVTGKYSGLYNPFSGGCAHNFCLILCGPRYPKRKAARHYQGYNRGLGRGGVYYRAEDVKIFTDKDPQTKSINTLLNSPKTYNRDQHRHHHQAHHGRHGSVHSTSSKPSSTAGSKQVASKPPSPPPASGPSGGVVIYYSPATSVSVSQVTAGIDPEQCTEDIKIEATSHPSSTGYDLILEESGEPKGRQESALQQSSSVANKAITATIYATSPSASSSSSTSTVIHQPIMCNQETMVIKSTSSVTSSTAIQANESSISVTPPTRMTGFKKYEISV